MKILFSFKKLAMVIAFSLANPLTCSNLIADEQPLSTASAQPNQHIHFPTQELLQFKHQSFAGETQYQLVTHGNHLVLKAEAQGQASALYRNVEIDLTRNPILKWRWRVDKEIGRASCRERVCMFV